MIEPQALRETPWHTREADDVVSELATDREQGLSGGEIDDRLQRYGRNQIRSAEAVPWYRILLHQFADPLIYILLLAAAVSVIFEEWTDATVILIVVVLNAAIGFYQEFRARKAIRALAEMSAPQAHVVRDGREREINNEEVVPGDVVVLASGLRVPADVRLLSAQDLRTDESALTGESEPVRKRVEPVEDEKAVPGDQLCMAFSGTNVTRGRGRGVVVRTGDASEIGRIARATQEMEHVKTPIQEKVGNVGKAIGVAILGLAVVVVVGGLLMGMDLGELMQTVVAIAVGGVPEALPVVLTVTLAVGLQRMARRHAIIRSLPAVETLGSTTVVGSDKTGTLTANQMTVKVIWSGGRRYDVSGSGYTPDGEIKAEDGASGDLPKSVRMTLLAGLLANESDRLPDDEGAGGDPTELAVLVSAAKAGCDPRETRSEHRQNAIIPFESERQFMATLNEMDDGRCIFLKGSPEAVLERCAKQLAADGSEDDLDDEKAREVSAGLAEEGYRVLGMAVKRTDAQSFMDDENPGDDLVFAGFQAMEDPVRPEAVEAVRVAHGAGIRVLMLTGDHARTARAIGDKLGLGGDGRVEEGRNLEERSDEDLDEIVHNVDVYARVSPEHKLRLVERLKAHGHIVAVTGDGVNDAPALRAAHLGVAMGKTGTDVAREASDMVLTDDNFASITNAVEEGRRVFDNIRKVTFFLLSTGLGLVLTILISLFAGSPLPYVPAQVLWINLVTNGLQDVALAFEKGEPGLLNQPPRDPREGVINRPVLIRLAWIGLLIMICTLGVFWWMLEQDASLELARSVAMTQMVIFQFFHVWNSRSMRRSVFQVPLSANPFLAVSLAVALLAHLGALHLPFMQEIFDTTPLALEHWGIVIAVGSVIILVSEIDKFILRRRIRTNQSGTDTGQFGGGQPQRADSDITSRPME